VGSTLEAVAAQAGVSTATVSRVVNDRPGVAPATRDRVRQVLSALGYRPTGGLAMPPRRDGTLVGIIVPELINPVFPAFAQAIEGRLGPHDLRSVVCTTGGSAVHEEEYTNALLVHGVGALVFVSSDMNDSASDRSLYARLYERGVPMVFVNGTIEGMGVPAVVTDEREAGRLAVQHLASLGHRRIAAIVGPLRHRPSLEKRAGFEEACRQLGSARPRVESADWGVEGGRAAMGRLLRGSRPTAVVCASDPMAIGAIEAIREKGLSVPGDMSVVGFDNTVLARHTGPPLTTVAQPIGRMAETVANLLIDEIAQRGDRTEPLVYTFRPELVVRATTAPPPERS
jgi:LacI family repressor for deo operon, udp, cdd, tsx, nupC, and nupG